LWGCLSLLCTMGDSRLLPPLPWREDSPTTSRIRNKEKKETKKIARGIFRSLAPLYCLSWELSALSRIAVCPAMTSIILRAKILKEKRRGKGKGGRFLNNPPNCHEAQERTADSDGHGEGVC
jgi:hypothetical protein